MSRISLCLQRTVRRESLFALGCCAASIAAFQPRLFVASACPLQQQQHQQRQISRATPIAMAPTPIPLPRHVCDALGLSKDEVAFREGSATIVLPTKEAAFLNPVQEFNRDLSVLALRAWSELRNEEKRKRFEETAHRRRAKQRKREAKELEKNATKRARLQNDGVSGNENGNRINEDGTDGHVDNDEAKPETGADEAQNNSSSIHEYRDAKFSCLEALSATGLRSIRYAREIPLLRNVMANDLSTTAVEAMRRNVALNFPAGRPIQRWQPTPIVQDTNQPRTKSKEELDEDAIADIENGISIADKATSTSDDSKVTSQGSSSDAVASSSVDVRAKNTPSAPPSIHPECNISISEADAMTLMYAHREEKKRFDVVDLDPYGSASMFLDGAVQSVSEGGMLCVTCTDTAVLAGTSHPEKCYSAYGGVTTKVEYSHEFALRLLLHAIAQSAGRYGRHIEPMLSLSIDFYIRVFVRVQTRPVEVKRLASSMGAVFTCVGCQLHSVLPFGRRTQHEAVNGQMLDKYQSGLGPKVGPSCDECGSRFHTAGPMWLGALHNTAFCERMLTIVDGEPERFATHARIQGMVGTAAEELCSGDRDAATADTLFYFTPSRISSFFNCSSPPLLQVVSALLHAGHRVSRSHCVPGSLKTTASRHDVYDLWRAFVKRTPVKMETISKTSPTYTLLSKPQREDSVWNLDDVHKDAKQIIQGTASSKGTRYQLNPLPNWGPGTAARTTRAK